MSDFLKTWSTKAPPGRALDIGAGVGNQARWLAARGFEVDAVESHPGQIEVLRLAAKGTGVKVHAMDILEFDLAPGRYSLITALAVLHFIAPSQLTLLAERMQAGLASGGLLLAQVFTVDDPGFEQAQGQGLVEIEPNTFAGEQPGNVLHYFEKDELRLLFPDLKVLHYSLERVIAPNSEAGYRSGAALVAQRLVEARSGS
jgi:cyclopropane fatty-acyl-phospholipid synthase-like methyltransferase